MMPQLSSMNQHGKKLGHQLLVLFKQVLALKLVLQVLNAPMTILSNLPTV